MPAAFAESWRRVAGARRSASGLAFALAIAGAALATVAVPARAQSPLDITADNMSGTHGPEGDIVMLNGHVSITRGRTVLTSDHGRYLRTAGMLYLDKNVKLVDSTTIVTCEHASYSEEKDVVELSGDVTLEDRDATLHAPAATYDRKAGRAELYGGVTGSDEERLITCDRAYYLRDQLLLQARGNAVANDVKNKLELKASAIDFDRNSHEALATGKPELTAEDERGRKAVIRALKLKVNTQTRLAEAIDSVTVDRDTLRARADYGLFDDQRQRGWLLGHPRAWDNQTTVAGDTLELWAQERELQRLVVRSHATVDYQGATAKQGETSRLTGERIDVHFSGEDIDSVVATGKAADEYRALPEKGKTSESNVSQGDTITVFLEKGKIDRAVVVGSARGEYTMAQDVADTSSGKEPEVIQYDANQIAYLVSKDRLLLEGSAHLIYSDLELHSKRVEYDVKRQTLLAEGSPQLLDRGDKVTGNLMTYDLESRVGNIYKAETTFERGLYHGQRIRKVNDNELHILNGSYTTCDLPNPHYHFASHWMKIYLKDKLVAKPVVFYLKNVPLLALPFWVFPIKPGRHSGFLFPQFELGFSNRAGQFVRNAGYYWAPNDYMDLAFSGDYYQFEPSWLIEAEGNYKKLYVLDGHFRTSFARNDNPFSPSENWDLTADHSQELTPRTRLAARASFVSSKDYNSSNLFGRSLYQRLNRFLVSSVSISHNADWASVNAAVERRQDLDADASLLDPDGEGPLQGSPPGTEAPLPTLTENVPTVSVGFPTRTLGSVGFLKNSPFQKMLSTLYFDFDTRFVSLREKRAFVSGYSTFTNEDSLLDSTTVIGERVTTRRGLASTTSLSDSRRLFGWINLQPSLNANTVVFDFDELGHKLVPTGTWSSALTTSATFYGTFLPRMGKVEGIRHIVTPSASFAYSPEFGNLIYVDDRGVRRNRFNSFGGIGVSGFKQFLMSFALAQRLQVKIKGKGDQVQRLDNLASWTMSGLYDFLYQEHNLPHPLSTIRNDLNIQPPGVVNANFSWVTDVYNQRPLQSLGYNMGFNLTSSKTDRPEAPSLPVDATQPIRDDDDIGLRENWAVDVAYSYSGGYQSPKRWSSSQTANVVLRYQVTPAWGLDYSASYDVTTSEMGIQRFELTRDLHCWQASFTRTFAPGGEAEYYFRIQVKEQKELFLERGTRGGSLGGIN